MTKYTIRTIVFFVLAIALLPITLIMLLVCPYVLALAYCRARGAYDEEDQWESHSR